MRTLNFQLAIGLLVGVLVFSGVVYVVHDAQVKGHATVFLKAAHRAKEQKQYREATENLRWYVSLVQGTPEGINAQDELATLCAEQAADWRSKAGAVREFEVLLREDPNRPKARRKLIELALGLGLSLHHPRFCSEAEEHIQFLLKDSPEDATLQFQLGQCQAGVGGHDPEAENSFRKAIELAPDRLEAYTGLAWVLQKQDRPELAREADQCMEDMVRKNLKSPTAHVLYGRYLLQGLGHAADAEAEKKVIAQAAAEAEQTLKLVPNDRDGLLLATHAATIGKDYDKARKYVARGEALYASDPIFYSVEADIDMREGKPKKALDTLRKALQATNYHVDILWKLAIQYLDERKLDEARDMTERLRSVKYLPLLLDFLDARLLYAQGDWPAALKALEKLRPRLTGILDLQKQADFFIGDCYHKTGNQDRELDAYRRAVSLDPLYARARVAIARVYLTNGRVNDALDEYRQVLRTGKAGNVAWLELAQMLIAKNLRMKPADRDWDSVVQVLDLAGKTMPNAVQLPLLRAEVLVDRGKATAAEDLLKAWRDKNPELPEFWIALATLAERQGELDKAETLLSEARHAVGDKVPLRLARAQYLTERYHGEAGARLHELAEKTEKFSPAEQLQLWSGLINFSHRIGDDEQARLLADRVAERSPNEVHGQFLRFQLTIPTKDYARMEAILAEIEKAAGKSAMWYYGKAACLSLQAEKEKGEKAQALLAEAQQDLTTAHEQAPTWPLPVLLKAGIEHQQGRLDLALKDYLEAIRLGERNPEAVQRAVQLLNQQRRWAEANVLLIQMEDRQLPLNSAVIPIAVVDAIRENEFDRAYKLIHDPKIVHSPNWRDQVWRGLVLGVLGRRAWQEGRLPEANTNFGDAEAALRGAIELNDQAPEAWVSLAQFFTGLHVPGRAPQLRDAKKAEEVLVQARARLPSKESHPALAEMYEAVGGAYDSLAKVSEYTKAAAEAAKDQEHAREAATNAKQYNAHAQKCKEQAQTEYEAALKVAPDDPTNVRNVADFYLRAQDLAAAAPLLTKLVGMKGKASAEDLVWGRRQLALITASMGGYANIRKALQMIEENLAGGDMAAEDLRAKATFQGGDPRRATRLAATETLETLLRLEGLATPEDSFTTARVYLALGNLPKFREHMRLLLAKNSQNPRFIAVYISAELEHEEIGEAEIWLDTLERLVPDAYFTVVLRADDLVRRQKPDEALKLLTKYAERPNVSQDELLAGQRDVVKKLEQFADRLSDAHETAAADRFLQKAESLCRLYVGQRPKEALMLAGFLARRGRLQEALDVAEAKWNGCDAVSVAHALEAIVKNAALVAEQNERIDKILQAALTEFQRPVPLLLVAASFRTQQKRYAEAETYYREVIAEGKEPNNGAALNNLAMLCVAEGAKLDEGLRLINSAMDYSGPMATMLDTRAMIYLAMKKPEEALADMNIVIGDGDEPPRLFHLAKIYFQMGRKTEAAEALTRARKGGLKESDLEAYERPSFEKLRDELR